MTGNGSIPKRTLGSSGITVSAIGLGCMSFSGVYGDGDDAAGIAVIHEALDRGVTFLDTSDMYGAGHNEECRQGDQGAPRRSRARDEIRQSRRARRQIGRRPAGICVLRCEASLKRLGVDVIDLYYQHRIDPTVPIEDTVGAMAKLVAQGKVRALGLSEARPETIARAPGRPPDRRGAERVFAALSGRSGRDAQTTRKLDIAFVAYAPLGRGLLTGAVEQPADLSRPTPAAATRGSRRKTSTATCLWSAAFRRSPAASTARRASSRSPGCWRRATTSFQFPAPSGRNASLENLGALQVSLSAADLAEIADAIPVGAAAGLRYPEAQMKSVYL